ncbi:MAG: hypothetical protein RMK91_10335 [Pseudanabaenaceae cyanobacterium SKYGB_i_bin29]|nr:hypothetical protein [Pseudanabaenaceae cyanobacterium SKYG29]MDW8422249.1 hypothetical protein [Pseudanabaenaceae cyanobacterium SKYGB_i_bin29]
MTAAAVIGLPGSGLTQQCWEWLAELQAGGVPLDRVIVLVRHGSQGRWWRQQWQERYGYSRGTVQVYGFVPFVQSQLSQFWVDVCQRQPGLPTTFQPVFLTKDLTQFLLTQVFDQCPDHLARFQSCPLPLYKIVDQIVSVGYVASSNCIPLATVGERLATAWTNRQDKTHQQMLASLPCCLHRLRELALTYQVIDFGYQWQLFGEVLLKVDRFWQGWDYLIVDQAEESNEVLLRFYQQAQQRGKNLFLAYTLGGGASYTSADRGVANFIYHNMSYQFNNDYPGMAKLGIKISEILETNLRIPIPPPPPENYRDRVFLQQADSYLGAAALTIDTVSVLLQQGVKPDRIAIILPKFDQVVTQLLQQAAIGERCLFLQPYVAFLRYPIVQAMLTVAQLVYREWQLFPTQAEVRNLLSICLPTDPIRASLLANTFDRTTGEFIVLPSSRIPHSVLEEFNYFHSRLISYQQDQPRLDCLWGNFIREFSPNFHMHPTDRSVLRSLMQAVQRFFDTFPTLSNLDFIQMLWSGQTPTVFPPVDYADKIIVATPLQFLKTDRETDYQIWFNITGKEWRKPICRELFNPAVLSANWQGGEYTPLIDQQLRRQRLARTLLHLCCRNQKQIYLIKAATTVSGEDIYGDLDQVIRQAVLKLG